MAVTITRHGDAPGRGGLNPVEAQVGRPLKIISVDANITSYTAGGEDLSSVHNDLKEVKAVLADNALGIVSNYDYTNKKLRCYWDKATAGASALGEVAAATNVGTVRVVFIGF